MLSSFVLRNVNPHYFQLIFRCTGLLNMSIHVLVFKNLLGPHRGDSIIAQQILLLYLKKRGKKEEKKENGSCLTSSR